MVEWLREVSGSTKNEWNSLEQHFHEYFILIQVGMPADFINKLSRMFQDIKVSEDLNNQFKDQQKDRDTKTGDSVSCFCYKSGRETRGCQLPKEWKSNGGANCNVSSVVKVWCLKSSLQVSIKILNVGAWARTSERVPVTLPRELEDFIPEVRPAIILLRQWHIWTLCPTVVLFSTRRWRSSTRRSTVAGSCSGTTTCPMAPSLSPTSSSPLLSSSVAKLWFSLTGLGSMIWRWPLFKWQCSFVGKTGRLPLVLRSVVRIISFVAEKLWLLC